MRLDLKYRSLRHFAEGQELDHRAGLQAGQVLGQLDEAVGGDQGGEDAGALARELLGRTMLYKVGHHGSHNATLAGELPLLVELPRGKGRVLWLNVSADRSWGDLPLSPVFVLSGVIDRPRGWPWVITSLRVC